MQPTVSRGQESQSFAESALRLGGKSEEEARRMGAVDKADEQVETLFAPQYQTVQQPHSQGDLGRQGAARAVRPAAAAGFRPVRRRHGSFL